MAFPIQENDFDREEMLQLYRNEARDEEVLFEEYGDPVEDEADAVETPATDLVTEAAVALLRSIFCCASAILACAAINRSPFAASACAADLFKDGPKTVGTPGCG